MSASPMIAGYVYCDGDNDGRLDRREHGIAAVTVTLTGTTRDGAPVSLTALTDEDGLYQFTDLPAGTYTLSESQPIGYFDGKDTAGDRKVDLGNDTFGNIVVKDHGKHSKLHGWWGGKRLYNFGELEPAQLTGYVYEDKNNNGLKDAGEAGITGATLKLTAKDDMGSFTRLATTDMTGRYEFTHLRPGVYGVQQEIQPAGFLDGKDTLGTLRGQRYGNDQFVNIYLDGHDRKDASGYNFGELKTAVTPTEADPKPPIFNGNDWFWNTKFGQDLKRYLQEIFNRHE